MGKYIKQATARNCRVHNSVKDACVDAIEKKGWFCKESILKKHKLISMSDSIRWDYIVIWINEELNTELLPVCSQFAKRTKEEVERFPQRFLASGHGKRTWGYVDADGEDGKVLVLRRYAQKKSVEIGTIKKNAASFERMVTKGHVTGQEDPRLIEQMKAMPTSGRLEH